jgi:hypothetical protein
MTERRHFRRAPGRPAPIGHADPQDLRAPGAGASGSEGFASSGDWHDRCCLVAAGRKSAMRPNGNPSLLIVAEAGCLLPSWLGKGEDSLLILRQGPTETLEALASRVAAAIEEVDARGDRIPSAIFLQGDRVDRRAILARVRIAGTVVNHMSWHDDGRLVLVPGGAPGGSARVQAAWLADCLRFQTRNLDRVTVVTSDELEDIAAEYDAPQVEVEPMPFAGTGLFGPPRLPAAA